MATRQVSVRKITVSVPADLVEFAERKAERDKCSRSHVISAALARARAAELERLAAAGYQFYADEATEFADSSASASTDAWAHGG